MGFAESARCVERESGTLALSDNVQKLRKCVFEGKWDELEGALKELGAFRTTDDATDAHYVLYKQKFLEYLENGNAEVRIIVTYNTLSSPRSTHSMLMLFLSMFDGSGSADVTEDESRSLLSCSRATSATVASDHVSHAR